MRISLDPLHPKLTLYKVRFAARDLQTEFSKTEDDIKAVQSVGQIIGEVLKQLDDERCEEDKLLEFVFLTCLHSHCQSVVRATICGVISTYVALGEAEGWDARQLGYDDSYDHADITARGRSTGLQHELGRSGRGIVRWYWWAG